MKRVPTASAGRAARPRVVESARVTAVAVAVACVLAPLAAWSQETVYIGGESSSVTVDLGVLEQLGPRPTVPDLLRPTLTRPVGAVPLRFPSRPPTFPTAPSGDRPVVLVPPPQTDKPTQWVPAPAAPPTPEIVAIPPIPVTVAPTLEVSPVEEGMATVEETVEVTAPVAPPPPPPPPEPEFAAPVMPTAPSTIPALPVITETPVPAPPTSQTAAVDPAAATTDREGATRLLFDRDDMELSDSAKAAIRDVAERLNADGTKRLQLLAYAGGAADDSSKARRLSLSRALAVRSELIALGVRSTRIDVRALGNKTDGGPTDRVDLILADR